MRNALTKSDKNDIIKKPTENCGSESAKRWRLLPSLEGSRISFSPFNTMRGGDSMYLTLAELLMIFTLLIAFADLLLKHFNDNDKT